MSMTRNKDRSTGLCLLLVLICGPVTGSARAEGGNRNEDSPIRLYATVGFGPMGKIDCNCLASGAVIVNGRAAGSEPMIWEGDLIETNAETGARVSLDSVGTVSLRRGTRVRLATALMKLDDNVTRRVLIASLISGGLTVVLQPDTAGYIESNGSAFTASGGASFRIGIKQDGVVVEAVSGAVNEAMLQRVSISFKYGGTVPPTPPNLPPNTIQAKSGKAVSTTHRAIGKPVITRRVKFDPGALPVGAQANPDENPVPFRRVHYIYDRSVGTFGSDYVVTNASGDAINTFTAANRPGGSELTVTIDPSDLGPDEEVTAWKGRIIVIKGPFLTRTKVVIAAAVAAVVVGGIIKRKDNPPIQRDGPPTSEP
jgi:hypothetical protein